jgi:uncharacterized membrane protein
VANRDLDRPKGEKRGLGLRRRSRADAERQGQWAEAIARFLGTPSFILWLTIFVVAWAGINYFLGDDGFDPWPFIGLTLMLSLQASYAAPLILLAQNRQADRDRVAAEQDRQRAERSLADTEYLAREVAALRQAINETATRDFLRSELRGLLEDLRELDAELAEHEPPAKPHRKSASGK